MPRSKGQLRIGTSGYQYKHWTERFYPADLRQKDWFGYYADHFDTVEINNTFYNLPGPETFDHWRETAPENFEYSLKFSRYGSHIKRMKDPDRTIPVFLQAAERLGSRLGPILVQLPPNWHRDPSRLDHFLAEAPDRHRWAVEVRDPDWLHDDVFEVLRSHQAALCIHDMIEDHPREITADWLYLRFHGEHYTGSYSNQYLTAEADRISHSLKEGLDVYAYFNNDEEAHAVYNAQTLTRYVNERL